MVVFYILNHDILALFDNYLPQDAHEFLNYLLNQIADILQGKISLFLCQFSKL